MQPEAQAAPETRYLFADTMYADAAIRVLQSDYRRNCNEKQKGEAYYRFINWVRKPNEVFVYTLYAYADLDLPKKFNCIFYCDNPRYYVLTDYQLTQSVLNGWFPYDGIGHGHKHICVFSFEGEVPGILNLLYQENGQFTDPPKSRHLLGFCDVRDLPAITARKEKDAQLKQQYGANWMDYYDQ
jgi:hypothetical protein